MSGTDPTRMGFRLRVVAGTPLTVTHGRDDLGPTVVVHWSDVGCLIHGTPDDLEWLGSALIGAARAATFDRIPLADIPAILRGDVA